MSELQTKYISSLRQALDWFVKARRVLLVAHIRPDGDALGSLAGLKRLLQCHGIAADVFLGDDSLPSPRYRRILGDDALSTGELPDISVFDGICTLDCGNPERLDLPQSVKLPDVLQGKLLNIDHHPDNSLYGQVNLVIPEATSTTEILMVLAEAGKWKIDPSAATALLMGLATDCGTFRFQNTTSRTFSCAAKLLDYGAQNHPLMDALHFREPIGKLQLQSRILERAGFAFEGKLAWSVLEPGDLAEFAIHSQDTENIIDVLRSVDTVEIACLLQPAAGHVRFSLRSRSAGLSAGRMARALGGGGHEAAAGAKVADISRDEAIARLLPLAEQELRGIFKL